MSSESQQPEPNVCPKCGHLIPPGASASCPICGNALVAAKDKMAATASPSLFDDLFDERGTPSWEKSNAPRESSPANEEPLRFPGSVDPFAATDDVVLEPLAGEPEDLFDFGVEGNGNIDSSQTSADPHSQTISHFGPNAQPKSAPGIRSIPDSDEPELPPLPFDDEPQESALEPSEMPKPGAVFQSGSGSDEDPDRPLRIDWSESENQGSNLEAVRCRICDSLVYVQPSQMGTKVKCPDCYSEILAEPAAPRRSANPAFPPMQGDSYVLTIDRAGANSEPDSEDEFRLSEPVERPQVPGHYGLEPETGDLLTPRVPAVDLRAERPTSGNKSPSNPALPRPASSLGSSTPSQAERVQPVSSERAKTESPEQAKSGALVGDKRTGLPPSNYVEEPPETTLETTLEDLSAPGPGLLNWLTIFAKDAWLWICFGLATFTLGFGYWCFETVAKWIGAAGEQRLWPIVNSLLVGIPGLIAFLFGIGLTVVVSALLFHLGGRKQPRLSDWTGYNFNDLAPAVGFVSVAFTLAIIPGLLLGMLVSAVTGSLTALPILVALSAALLMPLLAIGVCRNDSPFSVFDKQVFKVFRFEDVDWLKYLPGSLTAFFLFLFGTLFLLLDGLIWSAIGAAFQVAGCAVFGSLTGLYSGLMVEKVNQNES